MIKEAKGFGKARDVVRFIGLGRGYAQVWELLGVAADGVLSVRDLMETRWIGGRSG